MLRRTNGLIVAAVLAVMASGFWVGVNASGIAGTDGSHLIPYRGHLELNGAPVNTTVPMRLYLYDTRNAQTALWDEVQNVKVINGQFSVMLGRVHDLNDHLRAASATSSDLYLEIEIDGTLLRGRQKIGAVPFAYRGAPNSDFVVDGELFFGGRCIAEGVESVAGSTGGFNSITVGFGKTFTGLPSVVVLPGCPSAGCGGFDEDGMQVRDVGMTQFTASWLDTSGSSGVDSLHWIAVGPCL